MNTYVKVDPDYLAHHGVLGQKWGQRNGPPYPLKPGDHSAAEKKAGWTKSVSGNVTKKKTGKVGGFKEFATRNDPIVKWEQKRKAEKEANSSGKTGGISNAERIKAETSARRSTKNSIKEYDKAKSAKDEAKARNKEERSSESRYDLRKARAEVRAAERKTKQQLKADQGRELYAKGNTVEKYNRKRALAATADLGAQICAYALAKSGNEKAAWAVSLSAATLDIGYQVYANSQQNKLRAYYANS